MCSELRTFQSYVLPLVPRGSDKRGSTVNSILKVDGTMGNLPVQFFLDSGAAVSVVCYRALDNDYRHQITKSPTTTAVTANGAPLNILGQVTLPIT